MVALGLDEAEIASPGEASSHASTAADFPAWNRGALARAARRIFLPGFLLPLNRIFAHVHTHGLDNLRDLQPPVIFAANHQSYMDVPAILERASRPLALPRGSRDAQGILRRTFSRPQLYEQSELLPVDALLQRVSDSAARAGRARNPALHRRALERQLVPAHFPRRHHDRRRRNRAVSTGRRNDRIQARNPGGSHPHPRAWITCCTSLGKWLGLAASRSHSARRFTSTGDDYLALARQVEDAVRKL